MAPPTPTPAPNGTNATPEHRPPPALPPDPSEADIHPARELHVDQTTGTWTTTTTRGLSTPRLPALESANCGDLPPDGRTGRAFVV